jgi:predicted nucleic acid-binding protein
MIVVSDTTALSNLLQIDRIDLLPQLYAEVVVPPAVVSELEALRSNQNALKQFGQSQWFSIQEVTPSPLFSKLRNELDAGEAEAIVLATTIRPDWVLIDERAGRRIAKRMGLPITGTLGVLLLARRRQLIGELQPVLDELRTVGFYLSDALYAEVLQLEARL